MKVLDVIVTVLLIIGALNWGLIGFFDLNLVTAIFGEASTVTRVIYAVVGIASLVEILNFTIGYKDMHHRWCDLEAVKH